MLNCHGQQSGFILQLQSIATVQTPELTPAADGYTIATQSGRILCRFQRYITRQ